MSEKKRMTTWAPTIVMGVVAILFSVYALQEQTEAQRAKEEVDKLKTDLKAERSLIAECREAARIANAAAEAAKAEQLECLRSQKKK